MDYCGLLWINVDYCRLLYLCIELVSECSNGLLVLRVLLHQLTHTQLETGCLGNETKTNTVKFKLFTCNDT